MPWSPDTPELETTTVTIHRRDAADNDTLVLTLTGNQHRDLESHGRIEQLLARLCGPGRPEDALARTLDDIAGQAAQLH